MKRRLQRIAQNSRKRKFTATQKHLPYLNIKAQFASTVLKDEYLDSVGSQAKTDNQVQQKSDHKLWNLVLAYSIKTRLEKTCGFTSNVRFFLFLFLGALYCAIDGDDDNIILFLKTNFI